MKRQTISFDLDDTLFDVIELFIKYSNSHWGTSMDFDSIRDSDRVFKGLTDDEENSLWLKFLEDPVTMRIAPKPRVKQAIDTLAKKYRLITISARDPILQHAGKVWIDRHFKGKFDKVLFKKSKSGGNVKKSYLCLKEKAILHVDDNVKHIKDCQENGIKTILVNRPWNNGVKVNVKRIDEVSASEILESLQESS